MQIQVQIIFILYLLSTRFHVGSSTLSPGFEGHTGKAGRQQGLEALGYKAQGHGDKGLISVRTHGKLFTEPMEALQNQVSVYLIASYPLQCESCIC